MSPVRRTTGGEVAARRRISRLTVVVVVGAALLIARLCVVQVLDGARYASYAQGEVNQTVSLSSQRGAIYDADGDLLAVSVPRYDVIADDFLVTNAQSYASDLAPKLHLSVAHLLPLLREHNGYVVLKPEVTEATNNAVGALGLNGISSSVDPIRVSPGGAIFQPVLGAVNTAGKGYSGVEYKYNSLLSGRSGSEVIAEAPGGVRLSQAASDVHEPRQGESIELTIDEPLQVEVTKDVTAEMRTQHAHSGIAVVMDVHTGAILAMVDLVTGAHGAIVPATQNLALTSIYQPGSVMKLATFSFALQDHLINPSTVFTVPYSLNVGGYTFEDADYHPTEQMPASEILAQSSNIGTIEVSRLLGLDRLSKAFATLGFGKITSLDWPGESPGIVGTPGNWYGAAAGSVPIGTGVAVTPMQILDAYNAVANGGVMEPPHLLDSTIGTDGTEKAVSEPASHRILDASTVAELVPMLEGVVQDGTAVAAHIPGYTVAGKTGTAQVPLASGGYSQTDFNATFVGFVPAQAPQLSAIVTLNDPAGIYGGSVSAPVFAQIMQYALRHFDIPPPSAATIAAAKAAAEQ